MRAVVTWPSRLAAVVTALALAACAIAPLPVFPAKSARSAGVEWRMGARVFAGRLLFETGDGDALRLVVTAGRTVLTLTRRRGEWSAVGPLAGAPWRGVWNTAPASISDWMSLAEACEGAAFVAGEDSEVRTGRFSVRYRKRDGKLRVLELVAVATGDRFRVVF